MSGGISALFSLIVCFLVCSSEAQTKITAKAGQDVILPCKVPNNYNIKDTAVEWSRPGLEPHYVLLYRDGRLDPVLQHSSYKNRVDLLDKEMKDRDVSLILKIVTMEDSGTYECRVFENGKIELIIINLVVVEPGDKDGVIGDGGDKTGIIIGSVVCVIFLVVASVGFLIYRRHMRQNPNLPVPPEDPEV